MIVKFVRGIVLAEVESPAVRTASRALLSAVVTIAVLYARANGVG